GPRRPGQDVPAAATRVEDRRDAHVGLSAGARGLDQRDHRASPRSGVLHGEGVSPRRLTSEQREYVRRMTALVGGRDPLWLLRAGARALAAWTRGLGPAGLARRPAPTKWSVHEIVGHLLDYEVATGWRLRLMVAQPGSRLEGWDQDAWAAAFPYRRM